MEALKKEFEEVQKNDFGLTFIYPTKEQIDNMNTINRDMTENDKQAIKGDISNFKELESHWIPAFAGMTIWGVLDYGPDEYGVEGLSQE